MNITGKKIGIWGFGVVGQSALRFLSNQQSLMIGVIDAKEFSPEQRTTIDQYQAIPYRPEALDQFFMDHDICIASPGINTKPYRNLSITFICEIDIFHMFWRKPYYAITGSVGKTTITTLLSQLITHAGIRVAMGGNIGTGMLDLLENQDRYDCALLELSSFQLEYTELCAPHISLWTNFFPNHLDRHGTVAEYFNGKLGIMRHQLPNEISIIPLSLYNEVNSALQNDHKQYHILVDGQPDNSIIHQLSSVHVIYQLDEAGITKYDKNKSVLICSADFLPKISYPYNWLAITAFLDAIDIDAQELYKKESVFILPEHRLEYVTTIGSTYIYNDSKSTLPQATESAVNRFTGKKIALFVGGMSKGVDRGLFITSIAHQVYALYIFGSEAKDLALHAQNAPCTLFTDSSLEICIQACLKHHTDVDIVLFSPAGASYDQFTNYQERGVYFKQCIMQATQR